MSNRQINTSKSKNNYLNQLTWLRGIAAFFVIVSHTLQATQVKYLPNDEITHSILFSLFNLGNFGVVLFFILSGCTLYISNANKVGLTGLSSFYIKRFFRIWPAFAVALIVYIAFGFFFSQWYLQPQGHWIEKQFLANYSFYDVISYLSLTFNITGPSSIFNNAFWSLPVEFQYYLIFPLIIASLRIGIIGPIIIGLFLYLLPKLGVNFNANIVFMLAYSFCGGVIIGYIYQKTHLRISAFTGITLLCIIIILVSLLENAYFELPNLPILSTLWNWFVIFGIFSVYIVLITKIELKPRISKILQHYGTISYSVYLYHNIFVAIAVLLLINFNINDGYIRILSTFFFTFISSYYIAGLSYKYVEQPSIILGKKLISKS